MQKTHVSPIHGSGKPSAFGEPSVGIVPDIEADTGSTISHLDHILHFYLETDPVCGIGFKFSGNVSIVVKVIMLFIMRKCIQKLSK